MTSCAIGMPTSRRVNGCGASSALIGGTQSGQLRRQSGCRRRLFGDTVFANMIMLGAAWQQGLVPVSLAALMRAIELNDVAIEDNKRAFASGRLAVADSGFAASLEGTSHKAETLDEIVARRAEFLKAYQDAAYASRYLRRVNDARAIENSQSPGSGAFTTAVALSLFKLMAYKDEYEVGACITMPAFGRGCVRNSRANSPSPTIWLRRSLLQAETPEAGRSSGSLEHGFSRSLDCWRGSNSCGAQRSIFLAIRASEGWSANWSSGTIH